ncbi:MAG: hypothetical protein ACYTFK_00335 [Planctomycetota bacterium]
MANEGCIADTEWFCPGTTNNLRENENVSVVVWDKSSDTGYQMLGELEEEPPLPQVKRKLLISVKKMMRFKLAPHSDAEE